MKLVYTPTDGPPEEYDFQPGKLLSVEAEAIEDLKGVRWDSFEEFGQLFLKGNAKAHRAALWICMRRVDPSVTFEGLRYPLDALKITFSDAESERFIESIRSNPDLNEEQKTYLITTLELDIYEGEMKDSGSGPKEPLPSAGNDGSTSAPPDSVPDSES